MSFHSPSINIDIKYNNYYEAGVYEVPVPSAPPLEPTPLYPTYPVITPNNYTYVPQYYQLPMPKVLTKAIHDETIKLLRKADEMSSTILYGKASRSASCDSVYYPVAQKAAAPTYNFDFSDKSWKMFNNETHVHHHNYHNGNDSNEKKDDVGIRILVGVIGLIVAGITAFCIGKAMAENEDVQEENIEFEVVKGRWNVNKDCYAYDYQSTVDKIVLKVDALLQRQQTNRIHKIALLVFGFIGGGTAVAGALAGSATVMTVAAGIGACVIVAGLFKAGYACFSTRDQKDAQVIDRGLEELRKQTLIVVG